MEKYTLLTNVEEPSDQQLSGLMREVAQEAKRKALLAQQQLSETIAQEILKAQLLFKTK
jgi:hypothetical protein